MKVWEFAALMRYDCLKDCVLVKRGGEYLRKCRVEDLPHYEPGLLTRRTSWIDEHIEAIHMEAFHTPGTLSPRYMITLDLTEEKYDPVLGHVKGEDK